MKLKYQSLLQKRVLVRSNENEPYLEGTLTEIDTFEGKAPSGIPVVIDNKGSKWYCGGLLVEDTPENRTSLEGLTPKEQYDLILKNERANKLNGSID